ncbi:CNNM domain-containing protein [Marinicella rhabdoformis]|uniref:CNNM domain-containing protein n=1 Tax=Marinicella rhabdoformis TaxID=2580566 RepID=UPI0012AEBA49|nr:hemolysin family protein [Marinicella rhabdoformis]
MLLLIFYVFGALLFSFLCSIAEAVLLSITPAYIEKLKLTDAKKANLIKKLRFDDVDRSLAAILTLNTIAHTVGAIVAGAKATQVFGSEWIGVFSAVITVLILVFSEIIPKTIGAVYWKSLASLTMGFIAVLIKLLYPLIIASEFITKLISKGKKHHGFNRDEFIAMAGLGERTGLIDAHEARIINNLFQLGSLKIKDIMTPRSVITSLPAAAMIEDVFEQVSDLRFSRIPLTSKKNKDNPCFVLKSDVLLAHAKGENVSLESLQRPLEYVSEYLSLPLLLEHLFENNFHMALVVNEYGDVDGLVTLEDVFETLLGLEIMDESDKIEDLQIHARNKWARRAKSKGMVIDEDIK